MKTEMARAGKQDEVKVKELRFLESKHKGHTEDQSPTFNYVAYLQKIGCRISK